MQNNTDSQVYAGFFVRLSAYLIDWIIVGALLLVIRIPMWIASLSGTADFLLQDFIFQYSAYDIVLYLLKTAYFVLLTYYTGSTLGKKLLQIRVVSTEDRRPTFFEIVFRESVGKFLSALILYAGYIMIGADKTKRGLHDILSDTYVVYYHQKTVAVPVPVTYNTVRYTVANTQMPPYQAGAAGRGQYTNQNMQRGNGPAVPQQDMPQRNNPAMSQPDMQRRNEPEVPQQNMPQGNNSAVPQKSVPQAHGPVIPQQDLQKTEEDLSE